MSIVYFNEQTPEQIAMFEADIAKIKKDFISNTTPWEKRKDGYRKGGLKLTEQQKAVITNLIETGETIGTNQLFRRLDITKGNNTIKALKAYLDKHYIYEVYKGKYSFTAEKECPTQIDRTEQNILELLTTEERFFTYRYLAGTLYSISTEAKINEDYFNCIKGSIDTKIKDMVNKGLVECRYGFSDREGKPVPYNSERYEELAEDYANTYKAEFKTHREYMRVMLDYKKRYESSKVLRTDFLRHNEFSSSGLIIKATADITAQTPTVTNPPICYINRKDGSRLEIIPPPPTNVSYRDTTPSYSYIYGQRELREKPLHRTLNATMANKRDHNNIDFAFTLKPNSTPINQSITSEQDMSNATPEEYYQYMCGKVGISYEAVKARKDELYNEALNIATKKKLPKVTKTFWAEAIKEIMEEK